MRYETNQYAQCSPVGSNAHISSLFDVTARIQRVDVADARTRCVSRHGGFDRNSDRSFCDSMAILHSATDHWLWDIRDGWKELSG